MRNLIFLLIILFVSCGNEQITQVEMLEGLHGKNVIKYKTSNGTSFYTFGCDTILPVGSYEDDNGFWHLPDEDIDSIYIKD